MLAARRALLAIVTVLASALPASAQSSMPASGGGSLVYVWAWILIAGVIIFVVTTAISVRSGK